MLDQLFAWAAEQPELPSIGADFTTYQLGFWNARQHGTGELQYYPASVIELPGGHLGPFNLPARFSGRANYGLDPDLGEAVNVEVMAPGLSGTYFVSFVSPPGELGLTGFFVPTCFGPYGAPPQEGGVVCGLMSPGVSGGIFVAMQLGSLQLNPPC
jgi:hypothetical protein